MSELPQIPGYRLLKVLKQSKRSRTFLAEQQSLARQVALKVLSEEFFDDPALRQRFVDEGKSAARLNHPHVLAVFDIGSAGGFPFIATEFVPGGTLRDRMQQPMAPVDALRIARDLASALDYAHSQGVIHRDIKPANIMFRADGAAVLGDLGILKAQSGANSMQIGSPHYMSPEQIEGQTGDGRADLYSLGIVLYEMLTGRPPFDADDPFAVISKHLSEPVPKLPEALALYQPLIDRTLAKRPEERFGSAREMVTAIDGYIEPKTVREPRAEAMRAGPSRTVPVAPVAQPETQQMGPATVLQPAVTTALKPQPAAAPATPATPTKPVAAARAPAPKEGNLLKALLRIGILALVIAAIIWGVIRLVRGSGEQSQPAPAAVAQQLGGTQGMIEGDLAAAERLIAEKKWFAPEEDNAMKRINSARLANASPVRLGELTRMLAESVATEVLTLRKNGDTARAAALVAEARKQVPDEPALRAL
ncbi:MAG: serine/threonine protein kinase [Rhodanobacteraceae bacterium]|nr:serine/threonine protein kinase [Rhodanobacteraceae bacterium]